MTAAFLGEAIEQTDAEGVTSTSRDLVIVLPPSSKLGPHQADLVYSWADGRKDSRSIFWEVVPSVRVTPSRIILNRSEGVVMYTVVATTEDAPFVVTAVGPAPLVLGSEFSREPNRSHTIHLRVNTDRAAREEDPAITIHTDRADQPTLSLSVLLLPEGV